ncbi:hypothetical protein MLD38_005587 [Melastoma candidum]|uniref:Uncharacterized protein n=1 Tax=Melastoma candidum TaxID=119954 RepID=A0ACB9RTJ7_9MYRT|nr:hypothetical protein MLD38_005587 [Melastoma candidum]
MERGVLDGDPRAFEDCTGGVKEADGSLTKFEAQKGATVPEESEVHGTEFGGRREFDEPCVGMEFETYEDAYNYYSCYGREAGFRVRVKNSWFKRNSREKYGAVLCCSSQGFKRVKDVTRHRRETRTGCPAMIRVRLVESKRWRVLEAVLEHNHLLGGKSHKTFKKAGAASKRKMQMADVNADARTVKLYRALVMDAMGNNGSPSSGDRGPRNVSELPNIVNFRKGDAQAIYNFFCRMQLMNPNFFYLMDVSGDGYLRNIFWADARSRAAYVHFGDVVYFDNTCLSGKFEIPLATFIGMNHHGQSVLLGCALLAGEAMQSYSWAFKAWTSCISGNAPQTIISDQCKVLQSSISKAFPHTLHRFGLSHIMRRVPEKIGGLDNYDAIRRALMKVVHESMKVSEFETAWELMVHRFGVGDHEWLVSLYEDRACWVPAYLKDTFFAGMAAARPGETVNFFFEKYVHKQTPLKEFLDKYELALQKQHREESLADVESRSSVSYELKTRCSFEQQLSKVYTKNIFTKFQFEVEEMYSCFSTTQLYVDGPLVVFVVRERVTGEGNRQEIKDYEVLFNRSEEEVRCICSCFNFYGYLCRHALCVLNYNGVEEIPAKYILPRWRKDFKQLSSPDRGFHNTGSEDGAGRFGRLFRSALQIVEGGSISLEHYKVALQALGDCLNRVQRETVKL